MKDTKTVTPHVRADITFPFYILLYLSFWTNVMHYVFTDLLDRSLCSKSGDDHILVPLTRAPRTLAIQSSSQGTEGRNSSSLHEPNKGNVQKQPHLQEKVAVKNFSRISISVFKMDMKRAKNCFKKIEMRSPENLKNPGQRLIFPAILIAFCIMGALAGFLNGFISCYCCRNILSI